MPKGSYIKRTSSGKRNSMTRKPPISRKRMRRRVPTPLIITLIIIIIVVLVLIFVNPNKDEKLPEDNTGSQVSTPENVDGTDDANTDNPDDANPDTSDTGADSSPFANIDYDKLTPAQERDISGASKEYFNTLFIVGDAGYRYYKFSENQGINFINAVKSLSDSTSANVYSMVIPTASDIMLPQSFLSDVSTSDQEKAIDYFNASINQVAPDVKTVDLYNILKANCDREIYFKTDRNWTQLGAYFGYREFIKARGAEPKPLTDFNLVVDVDNFRGSLYSQSQQNSALEHTEQLLGFTPAGNIIATISNSDGDSFEKQLIGNPEGFEGADKYKIFLDGNHPYTSIVNHDLTDESSIIVVKDNMGNPFIPFLAAHYKNIYVVDYRYYSGSISDLATEKSASDILVMPQIELTSDDDLLPDFISVMK